MPPLNFDLDTPLIEFANKKDKPAYWTIRDAVEGLQIFGGIGSGKTSGSGRLVAHKYLQAGFGGLVLCAKVDEKELWESYCRDTGRLDDLVVLEPDGLHAFNFLEYVSSQSQSGGAITDNIAQVLKTVIRASEEKTSGKGDDQFWENALDMILASIIDLCQLAYGKTTVQAMYDIAQSLPNGKQDDEKTESAFYKAVDLARNKVKQQVQAWQFTLGEDRDISKSEQNERMHTEIPDSRIFKYAKDFFTGSLLNISSKTRAIINFSFLGFLFHLLRDPIFSLFCSKPSTVVPEDCLNGKIILINLPIKQYHKVGRDSQILFKYIWQRAMEKRDVRTNGQPVFLWADEAQHFLHEYDAEYQATARSSRIATVYLSQNLPNYYANMGGNKFEYKVKSFLGTLATKIFHSNADVETNEYASKLMGEAYTEHKSINATVAGELSAGENKEFVLEFSVRPELFGRLKTGGPLNNYKVEGYMHTQGKRLDGEFNFRKMFFTQQSLTI